MVGGDVQDIDSSFYRLAFWSILCKLLYLHSLPTSGTYQHLVSTGGWVIFADTVGTRVLTVAGLKARRKNIEWVLTTWHMFHFSHPNPMIHVAVF